MHCVYMHQSSDQKQAMHCVYTRQSSDQNQAIPGTDYDASVGRFKMNCLHTGQVLQLINPNKQGTLAAMPEPSRSDMKDHLYAA